MCFKLVEAALFFELDRKAPNKLTCNKANKPMRKPVDNLDSKALSANLAVTKPAQIVLTSEAEWLLSVTADHFGIHQRLSELLGEVYHPYMKPSLALKLMRKGILGDLWFLVSLADSGRALRAIFACYLEIAAGVKEENVARILGGG
ncbi:MAG TPA: hypothetical protein DCQ12_02610, partial [Candidatus Cloacimonas sp.]|nr:hypothetical protein [Candidatus Cloacimonas sp.]